MAGFQKADNRAIVWSVCVGGGGIIIRKVSQGRGHLNLNLRNKRKVLRGDNGEGILGKIKSMS